MIKRHISSVATVGINEPVAAEAVSPSLLKPLRERPTSRARIVKWIQVHFEANDVGQFRSGRWHFRPDEEISLMARRRAEGAKPRRELTAHWLAQAQQDAPVGAVPAYRQHGSGHDIEVVLELGFRQRRPGRDDRDWLLRHLQEQTFRTTLYSERLAGETRFWLTLVVPPQAVYEHRDDDYEFVGETVQSFSRKFINKSIRDHQKELNAFTGRNDLSHDVVINGSLTQVTHSRVDVKGCRTRAKLDEGAHRHVRLHTRGQGLCLPLLPNGDGDLARLVAARTCITDWCAATADLRSGKYDSREVHAKYPRPDLMMQQKMFEATKAWRPKNIERALESAMAFVFGEDSSYWPLTYDSVPLATKLEVFKAAKARYFAQGKLRRCRNKEIDQELEIAFCSLMSRERTIRRRKSTSRIWNRAAFYRGSYDPYWFDPDEIWDFLRLVRSAGLVGRRLDEINCLNWGKLRKGAKFVTTEMLAQALILCAKYVMKNKDASAPVNGVRAFYKSQGMPLHGSLASLLVRTLEEAGLLKCMVEANPKGHKATRYKISEGVFNTGYIQRLVASNIPVDMNRVAFRNRNGLEADSDVMCDEVASETVPQEFSLGGRVNVIVDLSQADIAGPEGGECVQVVTFDEAVRPDEKIGGYGCNHDEFAGGIPCPLRAGAAGDVEFEGGNCEVGVGVEGAGDVGCWGEGDDLSLDECAELMCLDEMEDEAAWIGGDDVPLVADADLMTDEELYDFTMFAA